MNDTRKPSMIVVDDDASMAKLMGRIGKAMGFDTTVTTSANAFMEVYRECGPSVLVLDIVMPDMDGIELLEWLANQNCTSPIVLTSGYGGKYIGIAGHIAAAKGMKICGTLTKPFEPAELEALLRRHLQPAPM